MVVCAYSPIALASGQVLRLKPAIKQDRTETITVHGNREPLLAGP